MTAAFHTLGCKVNFYETKQMTEALKKAGFEIINEREKADLYIVNTCTVTNMADRKSRQMLHRCKKNNPDCIVAAVGCYVDSGAEAIGSDSGVDILIKNSEKQNIVDIINGYIKNHEVCYLEKQPDSGEKKVSDENRFSGKCEVSDKNRISDTNRVFDKKRIYHKERTRAFIKVQDGCNQFCSYCIIPYVRGERKSREITEVVSEVKEIAAGGTKEIVITGIHLSSYGVDLQEEKDFVRLEGKPLIMLLREISKLDGIKRIRLGSLEPRIITRTFADSLSVLKKVCPHFHLSLQSGCDATLSRMNRHYLTDQYMEKCELLRSFYDNPAITADVIVGFPGENGDEFDRTVQFLKKVRLADIHVFKYSPRKGTKAEKMDGAVSETVKEERSKRLIVLGKKWSEEYFDSFVGRTQTVLFEEFISAKGRRYLCGHTENYLKINVSESDVLKKNYSQNGLYEIKIEQSMKK